MIINQIVKGSGGGGGPQNYVEKTKSSNTISTGPTVINMTGVTDIGDYALAGAYANNQNIGSVDLSNITTVGFCSMAFAFAGSSITDIDISGITDFDDWVGTFMNCTNLTSVTANQNVDSIWGCHNMFAESGITTPDFLGASTVEQTFGMYRDCTNLDSTISISSVTELGDSGAVMCFYATSGCSTMTWTNLQTIGCDALVGAYADSQIEVLRFPSLNGGSFQAGDPFTGMLRNCDNVTVHFPAALQATIRNWPSVQSGFGGTNTTVLFDL